MGDGESSEAPTKRYNTRPKTKSSLMALESRYEEYIVDTSPKPNKRSKSEEELDYSDYQRYIRPQMVSRNINQNQLPQQHMLQNYQGYQLGRDQTNPNVYQRTTMGRTYGNLYHPNYGTNIPAQMKLMYQNQRYGMQMNYPPAHMGPSMEPNLQNPVIINRMGYTRERSPYTIATEHYNPNVKGPMIIHPNYTQPQQPYNSSPPQQPYMSMNYIRNLSYPQPAQSDPPVPMMDKNVLAPNFRLHNATYQQIIPTLIPNMDQHMDSSTKPSEDKRASRAGPANEMQNYFKAVDVILKDISEDTKYENYEENSLGCLSIIEMFKPTDVYKMVNLEYTINDQFYTELTKYLDSMNKSDVQFPVNKPHGNKRNSNTGGSNWDNQLSGPSETIDDGEVTTNKNPDNTIDKMIEIETEFKDKNIKVKQEKKMHPITIDSYKHLTPKEARGFMNLLKTTKIVKANPIAKYRVKSIINKDDDINCNFWINMEDNVDNNYVLKQQLGFFVSNEFFNKRVPLYRNVDFGKTDPSFLFGPNLNKKSTKLTHNYIKVSRSYDIYITTLNCHIKVEISKMTSEIDLDRMDLLIASL